MAGLDDGQLIGLAGDLRLADGLDLTLAELAARGGTSEDRVRTVYASLGLDVETLAGFGEGDLALLSLAVDDDTGLIDQVGAELLRVAGTALRRVADATVAAYVQDIENDPDRRVDGLVGLAELNEFASELALEFGNTFGTMYRHHMWTAVRNQRTGQRGVGAPELIRAGIGFVDLVGFTPISRELPPHELMALVEEFEQRAFEIATQHGGRIVKSIGDEVMIAAPDHETVAAIAMALVNGFSDDRATRPRAGVSAGQVVFRLGDLYGPVVNMAARLADIATPGEVLTDVGEPGTGSISLCPAGKRELKGFDDPVDVWTVE